MIDIQIEKELIDVIENCKKKCMLKVTMHVNFATEVVNGLEELNSDETQANNLLGLNSELHEVDESNDAYLLETVPPVARNLLIKARNKH